MHKSRTQEEWPSSGERREADRKERLYDGAGP